MPAKPRTAKPRSACEEIFALQLAAAGINGWVREFRFHPTRKWRFDFAWPEKKLAVEAMGGVFWNSKGERGAHVTPTGYTKDCTKLCNAVILGWRVMYVTSSQVRSGEALAWLQEALSYSPD